MSPQDTARFWAKVERLAGDGACWLWTASVHPEGYGKFRVAGRMDRAHRVSWRLHHGEIPRGMCVLHNCPAGDNPRCVNPAHLWLGSRAENNRDRKAKGRGRAPSGPAHAATMRTVAARGDRNGARLHPGRLARGASHRAVMRRVAARGDRNGARLHPDCLPRGESHGRSKLTAAQVLAIRERAGSESRRALAAAFGVSAFTVNQIVTRRTWRHLEARS